MDIMVIEIGRFGLSEISFIVFFLSAAQRIALSAGGQDETTPL